MLGSNIKRLRRALDWTQADLAKRLGVQQGSVAKWEAGTVTVSAPMLKRLARVFGVTADELLTDTPTPAQRERLAAAVADIDESLLLRLREPGIAAQVAAFLDLGEAGQALLDAAAAIDARERGSSDESPRELRAAGSTRSGRGRRR